MTRDNILQLTFEAELDSNGNIIVPEEIAERLKSFPAKYNVTLTPGRESLLTCNGIDEGLLNKIASMQGLPEKVVIEFFECKGMISDESFPGRIHAYV